MATKPGEHKTVQARILHTAQEIGCTYVLRDEAERRRSFDPAGATPEERARKTRDAVIRDLEIIGEAAKHHLLRIARNLATALTPPAASRR